MEFNIKDNKNGVTAIVSGFSSAEIASKVEACKSGNCSCDCDSAVMESIENIEVSQSKEGTQITITGAVNSAIIAPMMQSCLMEEK